MTSLVQGATFTWDELVLPCALLQLCWRICQSADPVLVIFHNGTPLSRPQLISHLQDILSQVGVNITNFSGHSFQIGAVSMAAAAGLSDSFIRVDGNQQPSQHT